MPEMDDDIRAVAESIAADAERLKALEEAKVWAPPGDPKLRSLADQARLVVEDIAAETEEQTLLVDEATSAG